MANFSVVNTTAIGAGNAQGAITTTYKTMILANNSTTTTNTANYPSATLKRGRLYDILVGTNGTPADNYMEWDVVRATGGTSSVLAGGVSSVSSGFSLDVADSAGCANLVMINSSIETAYTAATEVFYVGVNQRASYRWVAAPGSEIVWPANTSATATNGLAGRARSGGYTGTATMMWLFQE